MKHTILSAILMFAGATAPMYGAETVDSVEFFFPQGKSVLLPEFRSNMESIGRVDSILHDSTATAVRVNSLRITGAASPEGPVDLNNRLSDRRAERIAETFPGLNGFRGADFSTSFLGRDWSSLRDLVTADSRVPYRREVLALLDEIITSDEARGGEREADHNLGRLKALRGGVPYSYLYTNLFPDLRYSRVYIDYTRVPRADLSLTPPQAEVHPPYTTIGLTYIALIPTEQENTRRNFYMSLKTNLLYDALALPTVGAEFYVGRNISVGADWTYGWWSRNSSHRFWRAYGGDLFARWWFGRKAHEKPLTGHHLGIYAGITTYDFEFGGKGRMGGLPGGTLWDRCMKMAGVEYGYSLPVARRLNIDFTVGIGYFGGKVMKYEPEGDGYLWKSTNHIQWFGPTKAEVSLVWLIGAGNCNRKGGEK